MPQKQAWKQIHQKRPSQQFNGSSSKISQSHSSSSFKFSKVNFRKAGKIDDGQIFQKQLRLLTIKRAKQRSQDYSILNDSKNQIKDTSFVESIDKEHKQNFQKSKTTTVKQFQKHVQGFMKKIKIIHHDLKDLANNMISTFEKMKQQMQVNLIQITEQMLKIQHNSISFDKINQIFEKGFNQISRTISILPISLLKQNNLTDTSYLMDSQAKSLKKKNSIQSTILKSKSRIGAFGSLNKTSSQVKRSESKQYELNTSILNIQMNRPVTQRKKQAFYAHRQDKQKQAMPNFRDNQQIDCQNSPNLQKIIKQIRQILNQ